MDFLVFLSSLLLATATILLWATADASRHDQLFERRYEIYRVFWEELGRLSQESLDPTEQIKQHNRLINEAQKARFLFGETTYAYLLSVITSISKRHRDILRLERAASEESRQRLIAEVIDGEEWLHRQIGQLSRELRPLLQIKSPSAIFQSAARCVIASSREILETTSNKIHGWLAKTTQKTGADG